MPKLAQALFALTAALMLVGVRGHIGSPASSEFVLYLLLALGITTFFFLVEALKARLSYTRVRD